LAVAENNSKMTDPISQPKDDSHKIDIVSGSDPIFQKALVEVNLAAGGDFMHAAYMAHISCPFLVTLRRHSHFSCPQGDNEPALESWHGLAPAG
jgi:hypothetical protein